MTAHFNTGLAAFGRDCNWLVLLNNSYAAALQVNHMMLSRFYASLPGELIYEARPIGCKPWQGRKSALLQRSMGIQRIKQYPFVSIEHAYPQILGPGRFPFQLRKLMEHFAFRRIQRANQRAVQPREWSLIAFQQLPQRFFPGIETTCQSAGQSFLLHACPQMLMPAENVGNVQAKFCKQARNERFNDRKSSSRQDRRHPPEKLVVNHLRRRRRCTRRSVEACPERWAATGR
jgi:hypothetical protein